MAVGTDWLQLLRTRLWPLDLVTTRLEAEAEHQTSPYSTVEDDEIQSPRTAAVLVPIVLRPDGLTVLLTQRADHLSSHAGQISFPGGRVEPEDESVAAAALRETDEEVGLSRDFITLIGALDIVETGTNFRIFPVVGLVEPGFTLRVDDNEVAEVFEVPLAFLMDGANHLREQTEWRGRTRHYFVIPYETRRIWGATAGMIVNLHDKLRAP